MITKDEVIKVLLSIVHMEGEEGDLIPSLYTINQIERFASACYKRGIEDSSKECWKASEFGFHRTPEEIDDAIRKLGETE